MNRFLFALFVVGGVVHADSVFNFDGDAVGLTAPFTNTGTGSTPTTAAFSSGTGSASVILSNSFLFNSDTPLLSGNALEAQGLTGVQINFGEELTAGTFNFGVEGGSTTPTGVTLYVYNNGTYEGSAYEAPSSTFNSPSGTKVWVGTVSSLPLAPGFEFNELTIGTTTNSTMVLDDIDVSVAANQPDPTSPTPEPSTMGMVGAASLLIGLGAWRFKKKAVA